MTANKSAFFRLEEQDTNMQVELSGDGKYLVTRLVSISFCMPMGEVLELHEVIYVLGMPKNLLSILV